MRSQLLRMCLMSVLWKSMHRLSVRLLQLHCSWCNSWQTFTIAATTFSMSCSQASNWDSPPHQTFRNSSIPLNTLVLWSLLNDVIVTWCWQRTSPLQTVWFSQSGSSFQSRTPMFKHQQFLPTNSTNISSHLLLLATSLFFKIFFFCWQLHKTFSK